MAQNIDRAIAAEQKRLSPKKIVSPKGSASGISVASSSGSAKDEVGKGTVRPPHRL